MKNIYEKALDEANARYNTARYNAVKACKEANHFFIDAMDGYPDWEKSFFGETGKEYFEAKKIFIEIRDKYYNEKERIEEAKKIEKAKWEAEHPEEVAAKKKANEIKRYKREIKKKKEEIKILEESIKRMEKKLEELGK